MDYHAHIPHAAGGYLCSARRSDWERSAASGVMIPCFGVHPWYAAETTAEELCRDLDAWLAACPRAQVGESGLDGQTALRDGWEAQMRLLDVHADAAIRHGRLLQLHSAGAAGLLLDWARQRAQGGLLPRVHLHAWNGSPEMAASWLRLGATFSAGVREWRSPKAARRYAVLPKDRLFPESDDDPATWPESLRLWEVWRIAECTDSA